MMPLTGAYTDAEDRRFPIFNNARGAAVLTSAPPFDFPGVTMRIFPLRARINSLDLFCKRYLNLMPPEIAEFRPALPYVMLMMVHYPRLAPEIRNVGWVSQNEVLFAVFVEQYRKAGDRYVFQDFGSVSPFIFVDSPGSQATGREVYGWPKDLAWLESAVDPWARNPDADRSLVQVRTMAFPEVYEGRRQKPSPLLEIGFRRPPRFTRFPPRAGGRGNPLVFGQEALAGGMEMMGNLLDLLTGLPGRGYPPRDPSQLPALAAKILGNVNPFSGRSKFKSYHVKQFRDAERPDRACFQALINSELEITRYNTGSLLGESALLRGDTSGGFRIKVHRYANLPILETLGIEIERERMGSSAPVAVLRPDFPSWIDVDLRYAPGKRICWRSRTGTWQRPDDLQDSRPATGRQRRARPKRATGDQEPAEFNTAGGGARSAAAGPFHFPRTTIRVLPLMADPTRLARLCRAYLNQNLGSSAPWAPPGHRFEPAGSYVYMLAISYEGLWSETNDVGQWVDRAVQFSIPIKWYDGNKQLVSMGLLTPYRYANSNIGTATTREVYGLPTAEARIVSPPDSWMNDFGPVTDHRDLLSLDTAALPALSAGQQIKQRRLLEIVEADALPYNAELDWLGVAAKWGDELHREVARKIALRDDNHRAFTALKALALEILANGKGYNEISLKQFRDSEDPSLACYQAAVRSKWTIDRLWDLQEIEKRIHLKIHRYASQPIVDTLGLKVKVVETGSSGVVEVLQPIRPFWLRADLSSGVVDNLWQLSVGGHLEKKTVDELDEPLYFTGDGERIDVGTELSETVDSAHFESALRGYDPEFRSGQAPIWNTRSKKQNLAVWAREWRRKVEVEGAAKSRLLSLPAAREAVETIEPQLAIESILSNEWGSWGDARWWRWWKKFRDTINDAATAGDLRTYFLQQLQLEKDLQSKPDFCVRRDSVGTSANEIFPLADSFDDDWYPARTEADLMDVGFMVMIARSALGEDERPDPGTGDRGDREPDSEAPRPEE